MTTRQTLALLRAYESRGITFMETDGSWPIVWERAKGVHVWAADGQKYLDLTAAFGVAAAGHANPRVVRAGQEQMAKLLHAMGDVHPHGLKAKLARELSRITFERWPVAADVGMRTVRRKKPTRLATSSATGKTIFCNSGFEAVEAAMKTAILATGKRGVIAFEGGYHGLGYGALNATHRNHFRGPFRAQLPEFGHFVPFPTERGYLDPQHARNSETLRPRTAALHEAETCIRRIFGREKIGAILVEPIQGRGGIKIPPSAFLPLLRELCDEQGALLILDEIYTGFGRTGKWFACAHSGVVPDIICLGKALTGGFPLSACVGRADVMDAAWPPSSGEAIHTSTFLGHPVGCAMALAQIAEIRRLKLTEYCAKIGRGFVKLLSSLRPPGSIRLRARGLGLMAGLELFNADGSPASADAMRVIKAMLHRGFILLPEGEHGNVISFTPPLTISEAQLNRTVHALADELGRLV